MAETHHKFKDLTGQVFGRWTVLAFSHRTGDTYFWLCRCACGTERAVTRQSFVKGKSVSCGCYHREKVGRVATKHGHARTPEYTAWCHMKQRCDNERDAEYKNYGARGIKVCRRWYSFPNFLADMGERPSPQHSLERRDNSEGYSPDNCYWATAEAQSNNRRRCQYVTHAGETKTVSQWAHQFGLPSNTFRGRLALGWSFERAASTPVR